MSMDLKIISIESNNVTEATNYKFLDYISLTTEKINDWYKLLDIDYTFLKEDGSELGAFNSYIYDKNKLIKFMEENKCELYNDILELIKETKYNYIIIQNF